MNPVPEDRRPPSGMGVSRAVFWPSAVILLGFVVLATALQEQTSSVVSKINETIIGDLGWYYVAIVSLFVIFCVWVGAGRFGSIRLGRDDEEPEYSLVSWLAMLFAAGMGIGLVFWGVAEPLNFFHAPKPGVGDGEAERAEFAMVQTFLHWGIHPWAIYVVVGLAIAYAVHRRNRPVSIRWALEPVLGDRVKGRLGDLVDVVAVVGTLFGVATSLGLGVLQISAGLDFVGWVDGPGLGLQVALIIGITAIATLSVVSGIGKGIKWLSNFNMALAAALMLFVMVAGPTLFVFSGLVQNIGGYLQNLLEMSFDTGASHGEEGSSWISGWTVFYWGWWISWAPFVGIFIARISRGRTVREFIAGVLLVPTLLTFLWYSVLGGTALHRELFGEGGLIGEEGVNNDTALFQLLEHLPAASIVSGLTILLIVTFFVTSSDSGSFVVDMLASGGTKNPPVWSRVFWSALEGAVAIALLVAGGGGKDSLTTLQTVAIIIALPFSVVMLFLCVSTWKSFHRERTAYLRARREAEQDRIIDKTIKALEESLETATLEAASGNRTAAGEATIARQRDQRD